MARQRELGRGDAGALARVLAAGLPFLAARDEDTTRPGAPREPARRTRPVQERAVLHRDLKRARP